MSDQNPKNVHGTAIHIFVQLYLEINVTKISFIVSASEVDGNTSCTSIVLNRGVSEKWLRSTLSLTA